MLLELFFLVPLVPVVGLNPDREEQGAQRQTLGSEHLFRWGGGLPCEGVGAKKFGMSLDCRDIPEIPGDTQVVWERAGDWKMESIEPLNVLGKSSVIWGHAQHIENSEKCRPQNSPKCFQIAWLRKTLRISGEYWEIVHAPILRRQRTAPKFHQKSLPAFNSKSQCKSEGKTKVC